MADRVELYATTEGGPNTATVEKMKEDAWRVVDAVGVTPSTRDGAAEAANGTARMNYSAKSNAYVMTFEGASELAVENFREATAQHRTPEAQAEMASELTKVREARAAAPKEAVEAAAKPEKAPKEELPPHVKIALYPTPVAVEGDADPKKAASFAMLKASEAAIEDLGLKGVAKNSYNIQSQNWVVGGRGLSEENLKGLEDRLSSYRTPEAEAAWRANAPVKDDAGRGAPGSKGPAKDEGVDPSVAQAASKAAGAGR